MNYGLYLSASGVQTNMYRQDVYANNLANVKTVGFKRDLAMISQRDPEAVEDGFNGDVSKRMLEKLGGGVYAGPQRISFAPSTLEHTGGDLDVAIESKDAFFAVSVKDSKSGEQQIRLTRDGRFTRSNDGHLITMAGGHKVLDDRDHPIEVPDGGQVAIDSDGRITVNGDEVATIQVTGVNDTDKLLKSGQNLFRWNGGQDPRAAMQNVSVKQGFVESSGVDPITTLMDLINATKAVTSNGNLIRYHDTLMDRAINTLGRVA